MLQKATLTFLRNLKKHNDKTWFDKNREAYEQAKGDYAGFIDQLIRRHGRRDPGILSLKAKDCLFRINRDLRFSKDKSPYKTVFGASITQGGKKSGLAGYYMHCEPGESFVGGGIWMPMAPELKKIRQEVDYCFDEFQKITNSKKFKSVFGLLQAGQEIPLSKVPQGFEKDNPAGPYLKFKSYIAMKPLSDTVVLSRDLLATASDAFAALQPLVAFINRALVT